MRKNACHHLTWFQPRAWQVWSPACRTKHQKEQRYPLNREGFDLIKEDLRLMCDNCHTYNKGNKECEESADMMWAEATKQLDIFYKKALNDIASLMSGHRTR